MGGKKLVTSRACVVPGVTDAMCAPQDIPYRLVSTLLKDDNFVTYGNNAGPISGRLCYTTLILPYQFNFYFYLSILRSVGGPSWTMDTRHDLDHSMIVIFSLHHADTFAAA